MPHGFEEVKRQAVSEVIGTIILIGVVMLGMGLVAILLLSNTLLQKYLSLTHHLEPVQDYLHISQGRGLPPTGNVSDPRERQ